MTKAELIKALQEHPAPGDTPVCSLDEDCMLGDYVPVHSLDEVNASIGSDGYYNRKGQKKKRNILVLL